MEYLAINGGRFFFIRILNVIRYYCVYFCLLLSLFVPQKNFSQQNTSIHFSHITLKEGLCGATVIKIYQDKEGYLWFCTTEGLQRYDGKNFKTFFNNPANKNSLPNDFVTDIKEDKFGRYWIIMGSHNGVCIYNPSNETFTQINLKKDSVEDGNAAGMGNIIFSADSNFMLITSPHGLYKFNVSTLKYKRFLIRDGLLNNWVDELYPIGYNLSLVATRTGLQIYNEAKDSFYNETNAPILKKLLVFNKNHEERGLIIDKTGKIWFGFWSPGFYCYDPKQDTIKEIILDSSDKKENIEKIVGPIVEDDKDNFFVSTYHSGIYYFNPRKNKVEEHFLNDPADPNSIISSSINALYYDNQKTLWVGTDGGISEFNKANNLFDYPVQQKNFTPNALLQSKDGHIWIGTYAGKGLFEFNEHFKLLHQYKVFEGVYNFNENGTWTLGQTHDGKIMVCRQGGFSLINPVTKEQNDFTDMRDLSARATINAYEDEQKNIWIGTTHAKLICLDSTHKHISIVPTSDWTFIMGKIGDKLLLNFHTNQHKFYCFDISTKQIHLEPYFFFKKRDSILVNQTQNIFTGIKFYGSYVYITTLRGLYVLNNQTGAVQHYTRANGLPSDEVSVLQKDSKGNIWLGTKQGLCVFDPVSKQFHGYGESEGLRNLEFQQFAMTQLNNGLMLACDNNNLVAFYPDSIMSVPVPPAPVITSLRIGNNEVPVSPNQKYFVSYKENNININFISLDFVHTRSIKYAYKLEGFDKDWRYVDNITSATYDNLDGGNYIFKVKAANAMGEWNTTITSLYFFISVPFYKQTWFFVLIAIIVIAILYTFYRMRIQRIIELQRVRNSISRDLHDEVGSTLSSISMLSTTAQHSLQNKEAGSAEMLIERISSSSQRILDVIDEIIWTINPRNDSLEDIIIRIRSFINDIVDTQGIKINMQADSLLEKINMPMKLKRNFYLIIKEALNNAANHAQCKTIDILIEKKHQSVLLQIKDDGKGFNAAKSFEGNGLKNMHQRAHEIRGEIKIKSEINKGTLLMLTVPIP